MNRITALLVASAVAGTFGLAGCAPSTSTHAASHKKDKSCLIKQDPQGQQVCIVTVPAHTGDNNNAYPMYYPYYLYGPYGPVYTSTYTVGSSSPTPANTSWRAAPPVASSSALPQGLTSLPTPTVAKLGENNEPEQDLSQTESLAEAEAGGAIVEDENSDLNQVADEVEANDNAPAEDAPAGDSNGGNDGNSGGDSGGSSDSGGGGGDAGGGGGDGGGGGGGGE